MKNSILATRCRALAVSLGLGIGLFAPQQSNAELLYRATWNVTSERTNGAFELSYQIAPFHGSLGDSVFIAPWLGNAVAPANSRVDWTFDSPLDLAYLNTGLSNSSDDFWIIQTPGGPTFTNPEACILSATVCAYGPIVGDPAVNKYRSPGSYTVTKMTVWLDPVVYVGGGVSARAGGFELFDSTSPVPEPTTWGLFAIGLLSVCLMPKVRHQLAGVLRHIAF